MDNTDEANDQYTANKSETKIHEQDDKQDDNGDHNCKDSVISLTAEEKGASEGWFKRSSAVFIEEIVQLKWRVFILICFIPVGDYYIYDFPGSMGMGNTSTIEAKFFNEGKEYTNTMNQGLYSAYSYPNVILAIFGGILIDSTLGIRTSMMIFSGMVTLGAFVFYLGVQFTYYELIMAGRVIFSLGGETVAVAQNAFLMRWFRGGRGVAFAFGSSIALLRAAASANFFFSPMISESYGVPYAALTGAFICLFSFVSGIALVFVDRYAEKNNLIVSLHNNNGHTVTDEQIGEKAKVTFMDRIKTIFLSIRTLPPQHWLICCICVFLYGANFPFVGFAKNFFEAKYELSSIDAGRTISIYQISAAVACPLAGIVCDRIGRNSYILAVTSVSFVLIHVIMIVTYIPPAAAMIIFAIFYSFLVSGLWPSVIFIVSPLVTGTSYGVLMAIQAIGSATVPLAIGAILDGNLDKSKPEPYPSTVTGYYYAEGVLIGLAVISLIFSIILAVVDKRMSGGILCVGSKKRSHIMRLRIEHPDKNLDCNEFHRATANDQQYTHDSV